MLLLPLVATLAAPAEGRPLFYWGARPPVVIADEKQEDPAPQARVLEVHAARDKDDLVVRLGFDRRVVEALRLPDGTPVSGRLNAVLYFDGDDDRATGLSQGSADLRTGCERRLEIGAIAMGADDEEQRKASAVVAASLWSLTSEGRRRTLWRADDEAEPGRVSAHGEWVELRIPADRLGLGPRPRIVLASGDRLSDGRLEK
jgi:hypothetical protein